MKYRKLDVDGDYVLGNAAVFLVDSPEAVAQAVITRLRLGRGEWFLDKTVGLARDQVLGKNAQDVADSAIRQCILGTAGVVEIAEYASARDSETRELEVSARLTTIYGSTPFKARL